jgi:hypothetical protein
MTSQAIHRSRRTPIVRALLALLAAAACLLAVSPGASAAAPCTPHWVGSWAASPNDGSLLQPFADQTLRMIVAPHLAGSTLRVHLSNRFGLLPVTLGPVTIGLQSSGASLVPGTERAVTFNG